jgi:hypothetical protein
MSCPLFLFSFCSSVGRSAHVSYASHTSANGQRRFAMCALHPSTAECPQIVPGSSDTQRASPFSRGREWHVPALSRAHRGEIVPLHPHASPLRHDGLGRIRQQSGERPPVELVGRRTSGAAMVRVAHRPGLSSRACAADPANASSPVGRKVQSQAVAAVETSSHVSTTNCVSVRT